MSIQVGLFLFGIPIRLKKLFDFAEASVLVKRSIEKKKGLGETKNAAVYALAADTIRFFEVLSEVAEKAGVFADRDAKKTDKYLIYVLCHDLLIGNGEIRGGGKSKVFVMKFKTRLLSEFARLKVSFSFLFCCFDAHPACF
jgi:hypothetical protein